MMIYDSVCSNTAMPMLTPHPNRTSSKSTNFLEMLATLQLCCIDSHYIVIIYSQTYIKQPVSGWSKTGLSIQVVS